MTKVSIRNRLRSSSVNRNFLEGNWRLPGAYLDAGSVWSLTYVHKTKFLGNEEKDDDNADSISSVSTNATADNIPGPGRTLDKLYQFLGRKLERCVFQVSVSSLHPNRIFRCLWQGEDYLEFCGRSTFDEAIRYAHDKLGSANVAGLRSLVNQVQSKSLNRSAAALLALVRLSTSSGPYKDFYVSSDSVLPLSQLEERVESLDDFDPEKNELRSLIVLAKARFHFPPKYEDYGSGEDLVSKLSEGLLRTLESWGTRNSDLILSISQTFLLFSKATNYLSYSRMNDVRTLKNVIEMTYFLIITIILQFSYAACTISSERRAAQLVLSTYLCWFDTIVSRLLDELPEYLALNIELLPLICTLPSPLLAISDAPINHLFPLFYGTVRDFGVIDKTLLPRETQPSPLSDTMLNSYNIDKSVLPRRNKGNATCLFNKHISASIPRSRRLLTSIKELKREVQECTFNCRHTNYSNARPKKSAIFDYDRQEINLKLSQTRAMRVQVDKSDLTQEFLNSRDIPLIARIGLINDDKTVFWKRYKSDCSMRHRWGEELRSNMDWDWDTGRCLNHLFRIENPTAVGATTSEGRTQDDTFNISVGDIQASSLKKIRVAYKSPEGEIKYKTFYAGPSTEDVFAGVHSASPDDLESKQTD